jgi:hypothetical protein
MLNSFTQYRSYNQEQKLLRQPHKCPLPQFNVVWMTEKRKFNPLFPTLIMGAGGRPTYFKMAENTKSLIIFALCMYVCVDGAVWGLAVQNLKFCQNLAITMT